MDRPTPPNFELVFDMLMHSDTNYSFFAASKLKSIIKALEVTKQAEYVPEFISRVS